MIIIEREMIVGKIAIIFSIVKDHNFSEYGHFALKRLGRVSEKSSFGELHCRRSNSWMGDRREVWLVSFDRAECGLSVDIKIKKILKWIRKMLVFWKSGSPENPQEYFENKWFSCVSIAPKLLFRMVSTAALYHVPIKSYSKNTKVPYILKLIIQ